MFKEVKSNVKGDVIKLAELFGAEGISGVYQGFQQGKFSKIHEILDQNNKKIRIFGSVSLDGFLSEELIGQTVLIECEDLIDTGKAYKKAIAKVKVWG